MFVCLDCISDVLTVTILTKEDVEDTFVCHLISEKGTV